jgi:hypothetical protein
MVTDVITGLMMTMVTLDTKVTAMPIITFPTEVTEFISSHWILWSCK